VFLAEHAADQGVDRDQKRELGCVGAQAESERRRRVTGLVCVHRPVSNAVP
jgi:hypothetical protein